MGCFFVCLRIKDDDDDDRRHRHRPQPHAIRSKKAPEVFVSQNRLSSLFLAEDTCGEDRESYVSGSPQISEDIKDEAKFLKACGTLLETPAEIRKATGKLEDPPPNHRDSEISKYHSWLPNTSIKKLQLNKQPQLSPTPVKLFEDSGNDSGSLEHTPTSCISNIENSKILALGSSGGKSTESVNMADKVQTVDDHDVITPLVSLPSVSHSQFRNKSVHFDRDITKSELLYNRSTIKPSPYPTPLKLSDDMQTPGTVFPTHVANVPEGKTRIRSEYVYTVPNHLQNNLPTKLLEEEGFNHDQLSGTLNESRELFADKTLTIGIGSEEASSGKDSKGEATLSAWLQSAVPRKSHFDKTLEDRPIIGLVATHWNEDEQSQVSQKWWDGNGIPNSTNKYKEDQKVSWHATPFEERLEKALSEDSLVSQRKHIVGTPVPLESEEGDTAISQSQSSARAKTVVSC